MMASCLDCICQGNKTLKLIIEPFDLDTKAKSKLEGQKLLRQFIMCDAVNHLMILRIIYSTYHV